MASTRRSFYNQLDILMAAITGVEISGHSQDWPDLTDYTQAELPLIWIKHGRVDFDAIPMKYVNEESFSIRIWYLDWALQGTANTTEDWIESVVEKVGSDNTLDGNVNCVGVEGAEPQLSDFPLRSVEVECRAVHHTSRVDF